MKLPIKDKTKWHDWFAWRPVKITKNNGNPCNEWRWLETVERLKFYWIGFSDNYYRAKDKAK